jgi:chromosome partitioning protein
MPQGTSASWYAVREQAGKAGNLIADTAANHAELVERVSQYQDVDYIVLDGPPRIAEMTRAIMMLADVCLIPVGASVAEIWATADVLTIIEAAKKVRPINARMIWTRHRSFTNLAKELTEQATAELGLPILKTAMALRVAYPEALGSGLTVAEMPDTNARIEMRYLVAEVRKLLR